MLFLRTPPALSGVLSRSVAAETRLRSCPRTSRLPTLLHTRGVHHFIVANSFLGKTCLFEPYTPQYETVGGKEQLKTLFPADSPINAWLQPTLKAHQWHPGEDFFFVQPFDAPLGFECPERSELPEKAVLDAEGACYRQPSALKATGMAVHRDLAVGVADGVGGVAELGIDPAIFSEGLMFHCAEAAASGLRKPLDILARGYDAVLKDDLVPEGSSTACVLAFSRGHDERSESSAGSIDSPAASKESLAGSSESGAKPPSPAETDAETEPSSQESSADKILNHQGTILSACNLGDSTFYVLRGGKVAYMQAPQTLYFNAPYQLSKYAPHRDMATLAMTPESGASLQLALEAGDVVILTTDGLSDNVFPEEIEEIYALIENEAQKKTVTLGDKVQTFADTLLAFTAISQTTPDRVSPFEIEARNNNIMDMTGGKVDDINVTVVQVCE